MLRVLGIELKVSVEAGENQRALFRGSAWGTVPLLGGMTETGSIFATILKEAWIQPGMGYKVGGWKGSQGGTEIWNTHMNLLGDELKMWNFLPFISNFAANAAVTDVEGNV